MLRGTAAIHWLLHSYANESSSSSSSSSTSAAPPLSVAFKCLGHGVFARVSSIDSYATGFEDLCRGGALMQMSGVLRFPRSDWPPRRGKGAPIRSARICISILFSFLYISSATWNAKFMNYFRNLSQFWSFERVSHSFICFHVFFVYLVCFMQHDLSRQYKKQSSSNQFWIWWTLNGFYRVSSS